MRVGYSLEDVETCSPPVVWGWAEVTAAGHAAHFSELGDPAQTISSANIATRRLLSECTLRTRMPLARMFPVLESGQFMSRSQLGGQLDDRRLATEANLFGCDRSDDQNPTNRPFYGYAFPRGYDHLEDRAEWYGPVIVTFKPSVSDYAITPPTVVFGDSIIATEGGTARLIAPSSVVQPIAICYRHEDQMPITDLGGIEQFTYRQPSGDHYPEFVEVQFHEPLGSADIESVIILASIDLSDETRTLEARLEALLTESGIPCTMNRRNDG